LRFTEASPKPHEFTSNGLLPGEASLSSLVVEPLPNSDALHVRAAEGWLELGNHVEASVELGQITPEHRAHPDVLNLRWLICQRAKDWNSCMEVARSLTDNYPSDPRGWVALAETLYFEKHYQDAYDLAVSKITTFPQYWPLYYDSACYACLTGRLEQAKQFLQLAMAYGEASAVRRKALEDPDLTSLWKAH
jgi:hypothetical protein